MRVQIERGEARVSIADEKLGICIELSGVVRSFSDERISSEEVNRLAQELKEYASQLVSDGENDECSSSDS